MSSSRARPCATWSARSWATPFCWWTRRTICRTAPARYFPPNCWRKRCATWRAGFCSKPGELFESISETIARRGGASARDGDALAEGPAIAEIEPPADAVAGAVEGMGAEIHPLPCVETRAETRRPGGSDSRFAFRLAAVHRHFEPVRPGLYLRDRKAEQVPSSGPRLPGPGAGLGPHFSRGLLDRFVFGHAFARGNDAAYVGPGKGTHPLHHPAAALSAGTSQSHDPAPGADDLRGAGQKFWRDCRAWSPQMSDARNGNGLVLFPSYQFLEKVAERLPPIRAPLLVQRPNITAVRAAAKFSMPWPRRRPAAFCCSPSWAGCMPRAWIIRANF